MVAVVWGAAMFWGKAQGRCCPFGRRLPTESTTPYTVVYTDHQNITHKHDGAWCAPPTACRLHSPFPLPIQRQQHPCCAFSTPPPHNHAVNTLFCCSMNAHAASMFTTSLTHFSYVHCTTFSNACFCQVLSNSNDI